MIVHLAPFFRDEGEGVKRGQAQRLRQGRGVNGQPLARKARPDGRPLGGRLPSVIRGAPVRADETGFLITYPDAVSGFHRGNARHGQPPRRIVGFSRGEEKGITRRAARRAADQIQQRLRRGR